MNLDEQLLALAAIYEAQAGPGGEDRRGDAPDRSRLGDEVQRPWAGRAGRSLQAAQFAVGSERRAPRRAHPRYSRTATIPTRAHGVVRWRIVGLCGSPRCVVVAKQTVSRELRAMGYRKLSARPRHHEQAEGAIENLKLSRAPGCEIRAREEHPENLPPPRSGLAPSKGHIGQKNKITRR